MPITLSIDTCLGEGSALVLRDGEELVSVGVLGTGRRDTPPLHEIDAMLKRVGLGLASPDRIFVTRGPGSFTGVRTGLAVLRGLLRSREMDYATCTVMEALTMLAPDSAERCRTVIYAGKREAAVQDFEWAGSHFRSTGKHYLVPKETLLHDVEGAVILGPGIGEEIGTNLSKRKGGQVIVAKTNLAACAYRFIVSAGNSGETRSLEAVYTRDFVVGNS